MTSGLWVVSPPRISNVTDRKFAPKTAKKQVSVGGAGQANVAVTDCARTSLVNEHPRARRRPADRIAIVSVDAAPRPLILGSVSALAEL